MTLTYLWPSYKLDFAHHNALVYVHYNLPQRVRQLGILDVGAIFLDIFVYVEGGVQGTCVVRGAIARGSKGDAASIGAEDVGLSLIL